MAPTTVTPRAVEAKKTLAVPKKPTLSRTLTANIGTKRKIICFSGTRMQPADLEPHLSKRPLTVLLIRLRRNNFYARYWPHPF